jgi:hypothetical protein
MKRYAGQRRWFLLPLLLVLARPVAAAENTLPVTIDRFVGVPADSADRRDLMQAFRATMDGELPCERRSGDTWTPSGPHRNPFRVVDVAPSDAAWTLDLELGVPSQIRVARAKPKGSKVTPRPRMSGLRASRGLVIVVAVSSPAAAGQDQRPDPVRFSVYFADAHRVVAPSDKLAGGAYLYPWADVGRVAALAALEVLHRANATLEEDERADLAPATRQEETP